MFEDISKRSSVADVISGAYKISNFIYNYVWLLTEKRKYYGGVIVWLIATRFATNYITLHNLLKKMVYLKRLFMSDKWAAHKLSRTNIGRDMEKLMFDH